jgi:glycosyltransferase involved in cell wall biosynthesis
MFREVFGAPAVCCFGAFNTDYPRNKIIRLGLERHGIRSVYCTAAPSFFPARCLKLAARFLLEARGCRWILVGEGRHLDAPLARLLGLLFGKRVILDAFVSHYDTWVLDRAKFAPGSLKARLLAFADRIGPLAAHRALLDTEAHIDFYSRTFKIPRERFLCVRVGADDTVYKPAPDARDGGGEFRVLFFGSFMPLHGADTIIRAAKLLEGEPDIVFDIVDCGDTFAGVRKLSDEFGLKNVVFHPPTSKEEIARMIARCDVSLGIFGTTGKASRVIPNNNYQALAMRKPIVTMDSPAAHELLVHGENALLCQPADPRALADSILSLRRDPALRGRIAENGYALFREKLTPEKIVAPLVELLNGNTI